MVYWKMVNFRKKRLMKANTIAFSESKLTNKQNMTGVSYLQKYSFMGFSVCPINYILYSIVSTVVYGK